MKNTQTRRHLPYLYFALGLCALFIASLASTSAPTQAALKPPASPYVGKLDSADCSSITGYAYDPNAIDQTLSVDLYKNSVHFATVPANLFRRDLFGAGLENPYHGFALLTPSSFKDGNIYSIGANFATTSDGLSGSPKFIACNSSLFANAVPATTASGEGKTWEQGVEISSSLEGTIKEVKFWRAADEPQGGHIARIWSNSGSLLASKSFTENSSPGWQSATMNFRISPGDRYRITYNIHKTVAKTFFVFNNGPITKGPLTAWTSWYGTPAGNFPTSNSSSNFFADVVFNGPR